MIKESICFYYAMDFFQIYAIPLFLGMDTSCPRLIGCEAGGPERALHRCTSKHDIAHPAEDRGPRTPDIRGEILAQARLQCREEGPAGGLVVLRPDAVADMAAAQVRQGRHHPRKTVQA